ncbi:hypothetical protein BTA30_15315 [Bacillus swezeyi]|uniref:Uncharacterized protein n=2 Tax=Bacillus swezeyi TaxID=1925020 RepID=A0A1R1QKK9_9BACI|nr:hypothetical protein BW143_11720 [Bacillus swezeyi]OMI28649.1 hypothetical protein BTA30_15315 [Bacillus swezeyi]
MHFLLTPDFYILLRQAEFYQYVIRFFKLKLMYAPHRYSLTFRFIVLQWSRILTRKVLMMGTIVLMKSRELTVLEDVSKDVYEEMAKNVADGEDKVYISWKENLDSDYGY